MRDYNLKLSPFHTLDVLSCHIKKCVNDHMRFEFCGLIQPEDEENFLKAGLEDIAVELSMVGDDGSLLWCCTGHSNPSGGRPAAAYRRGGERYILRGSGKVCSGLPGQQFYLRRCVEAQREKLSKFRPFYGSRQRQPDRRSGGAVS